MSAKAGWYPDPGGGQGLYRYWDGKAWSAATSPNPKAPAPSASLLGPPQPTQVLEPTQVYPSVQHVTAGSGTAGSHGQQPGPGYAPTATPNAYATFQQTQRRKSPVGWWIAGGALLVVLVVIGVLAVRAISGSSATTGTPPGSQPSENACPTVNSASPESSAPHPNDGRVHGGPVSYPELGSPWSPPGTDYRVPFGRDVSTQTVMVQQNYDAKGSSWVASILVGELQAGDGFFTPQQGAQIVVKCILGAFYGDNPVKSDVKVNKATSIDGHDGWLVESQLSFDIPNLVTKGELLIVAIVSAGETAGLYYASIPDTVPELVEPARQSLADLTVDS